MTASRSTLLVAILAAPLSLGACGESPTTTPEPELPTAASPKAEELEGSGLPASGLFRVHLQALNESGVRGTATLAVRKGELTVVLNAVGHEVGQVHAQHIHGFTDGTDGSCPAPELDPDGDGVLTIGEGLPFYGPVQLALTPFPNPSNRGGAISYRVSFPTAGLAFSPDDLEDKTVVLHGRTVNDAYVGSLPVACGSVERVN